MEETRSSGARFRHLMATLMLLLAVAAALQFSDLDSKSLWYDEVISVRIAGQPDLGSMFGEYRDSERQPPLHHLLLHGWMRLAGARDTAVRIPSALLSVASVGLLFWLGFMLAGARTAVLSAYLLAISPFLLLFGRMARYYSLSLFLALGSTSLLVKALRRTEIGAGSPATWAGYAAATVGMLLVNYGNGAVFIAQVVFVALWLVWHARSSEASNDLRKVRNSWLATLVLIAMAFGVWIAADWGRIVAFGRPVRAFDIQGVKALTLNLLYPPYAFGLGQTIFPWHPLGLAGLVVLAVVILLALKRLRDLGVWAWLVIVGFAGTLLITLVAFQFFVRDLPFATLPTRAIGAFPFFLLIAGMGLAALRRKVLAAALIVITAASGVAGWNYFTGQQFHNPIYAVPSREIAEMVEASAKPDDLLVADYDSGFDYYYRRGTGDPRLLSAQENESVRRAVEGGRHPRVWLITLGRDGTRELAPTELRTWLSQRFRLTRSWEYVPQDPTFRKIKELIQGFEGYRYKAVVELFER